MLLKMLLRLGSIFCVVCFTEDRCPPVQSVSNAAPDFIITPHGIVITYECNHGYIYPDGDSVKQLACLVTGVWNGSLPACERKTISLRYTNFQCLVFIVVKHLEMDRRVYFKRKLGNRHVIIRLLMLKWIIVPISAMGLTPPNGPRTCTPKHFTTWLPYHWFGFTGSCGVSCLANSQQHCSRAIRKYILQYYGQHFVWHRPYLP